LGTPETKHFVLDPQLYEGAAQETEPTTTKETAKLAQVDPASQTLVVPVAAVPEMTPVEVFKLAHPGKAPSEILQV
jgi:hypothetical protein